MTIEIVGLGPGGAGLLTTETTALLASGAPVILRTRRHPVVDHLPGASTFADCDDLYQSSPTFEAAYRAVAARVLAAAAEGGDVVYAVPGHPLIAEQTVVAILLAAPAHGVSVRIHAAVSFVDMAAVALTEDFSSIQVCDALDLRIDTRRPALIGQVFDRDTATRLKLLLLDIYPSDHPVRLLRALGTAQSEVRELQLAKLDHQANGYLDAVFIPALDPLADVRRLDGVESVVRQLHAPGGCPWDREQTHISLRSHLLEETYEVLAAIDAGEPGHLAEELGDLLLQVLMHAAVGEREGTFALGDVTEQIMTKLIRRHPHVFADGDAKTSADVAHNWETLKKAEKKRDSTLDGVPPDLPALAASQTIQGRARKAGFDWPDIEGPLAKLQEEIGEFARAEGSADREDEFGDILFVVANVAQRLGIDAEQALRRANDKFRRRFTGVEALATASGVDLASLDLAGLDTLWDEAKALLEK